MSRRTRVFRGVWQIGCPECGAVVDVEQTDVGQYDCIEIEVDCGACGAVLHTETIVMVVVSADRADVLARADRIRELAGARDAEPVGGLVADVRRRRGR